MSGGKQATVEATPAYPGAGTAMTNLSNTAAAVSGTMGQPYGGQLVAGFSPSQQVGQNELMNYMSTNPNQYMYDPGYQAARSDLMNTAAGKYVSPNSPFTQGMQQYYMTQVYPQIQAQMNQQAARMGPLSGSAYENMTQNVTSQAEDYLSALGAQNWQTERQNQLNAISPAMSLTQQEQYAPSTWIQNLMSLGAPAQQQQQNQLTAAYNEFLRQRQEQLSTLNLAPAASQVMNYSYDPGKPSFFQQYISPMMSVLGSSGGQNMMGGIGTGLSSFFGGKSNQGVAGGGFGSGLSSYESPSFYGGGNLSDSFSNYQAGQLGSMDTGSQLSNFNLGGYSY
jgi:hypothetical protein